MNYDVFEKKTAIEFKKNSNEHKMNINELRMNIKFTGNKKWIYDLSCY